MKKVIIFSNLVLCVLTAGAVTLNLTPGSLQDYIADIPASDTEIIITGEVNTKDLAELAELRRLGATPTILDLTDTSIASTRYSSGNYLGYTYLPAAELPPYIFSQTAFTEVKLPNSVNVIGEGAFSGSALTKISLPEDVTSIGDFAFYDCKYLASVTFGPNLKSIGKGAFSNCTTLTDINLSATAVTELPEKTFAGCTALASITLPAGLESVGTEAFAGTALTTLSLATVKKLDPFALSGMPELKTASLSAEAHQQEGLFAGDKSLTEIAGATEYIPDAYAAGCSSFQADNLLPNVVSVGQHALAGTANVESMTLAPSLMSVDNEAFSGLSSLKVINAYSLGSNVPYAAKNAFDGLDPAKIDLLVAEENQDAWKADEQWSKFNITADPSTSADNISVESSIRISLTPSAIDIQASEPLNEVYVCQLDGKVLTNLNPQAQKCTIALPADKAVIVKASTSSESKTVKLLLR